MKRICLFLLLASLVACAPSVYDVSYPVQPVVLPRDDAAHDAPIEWWYYTGHMQAENGEDLDLGFELSLFKAFLPPSIKLFGAYPLYNTLERGHVGHFALSDNKAKQFVMGQRSDFALYEGGASADELSVHVSNWSVVRAPDGVSHRIRASEGGYSIDLTLTPEKPAALHGEPPGIQSMGPGGVSYYVSYTRMELTGTLKRNCGFLGLGCETLAVTGQAWSDHQWGDFDLSSYAGWDWFSMQFSDNTELMLYFIRAADGSYLAQAGSFITRSGETVPLRRQDIVLTHLGETWTSPGTGAIYPLNWRVEVPGQGVDVTVTPTFPEQEMDTRASTGIVYWEGAVRLTGSHSGLGYVELTNYDRYPFGKTDANTKLQPLRGPFCNAEFRQRSGSFGG